MERSVECYMRMMRLCDQNRFGRVLHGKVELLSRLVKISVIGLRGYRTTTEPSISLSVILRQAEIASELALRGV